MDTLRNRLVLFGALIGLAGWRGGAQCGPTAAPIAAAPAYDLAWSGEDFAVVGAVVGTGPNQSPGALRVGTNCPAAATLVSTSCAGTIGPVELASIELPRSDVGRRRTDRVAPA